MQGLDMEKRLVPVRWLLYIRNRKILMLLGNLSYFCRAQNYNALQKTIVLVIVGYNDKALSRMPDWGTASFPVQ